MELRRINAVPVPYRELHTICDIRELSNTPGTIRYAHGAEFTLSDTGLCCHTCIFINLAFSEVVHCQMQICTAVPFFQKL